MSRLYRRIFKSQLTGPETLRELLETMFISEMLSPGPVIYIISPWVSNIILIDNRSGTFDTLNPEWGHKEVRVVDVIVSLMSRGCRVVIVTRNDEKNTSFLNLLNDQAAQNGLENAVTTYSRNSLHTKGILLTGCSLLGSMNLTYFGLHLNDEQVTFSIDKEDLAHTRLEFERYVASL
jgi:phosphatidylserine/phosphatidylglycerophosphate/cardiolipin synthase-like enzyme